MTLSVLKKFKVTIHDLIGRGKIFGSASDISSVVFWYQTEPHHNFPKLPSKNELEVN
jgi:hypothetical protein